MFRTIVVFTHSAVATYRFARAGFPSRSISVANFTHRSRCFFIDFHAGNHSMLALLMSKVPSFPEDS
jgi:hypothetical protein